MSVSKKEVAEVKKAMSLPHEVLNDRTYKVMDNFDRVYGGYRGRESGRGDSLDETLELANRYETNRYRQLMVHRASLEVEKDVKNLEKEVKGTAATPSAPLTPDMIINKSEMDYIQSFPEDQRGMVVQAMSSYKAGISSSGGKDSVGGIAPFFMMQLLQQKPQTGIIELVGALRGMNDIINTGKPAGATTDATLAIAKLLLELRDKDHATVTNLYQELLKDRNIDPVQYTESIINVAKGMGMAPSTGTNFEATKYSKDIDLKIEELKWDRQAKFSEMENRQAFQSQLLEKLSPAINSLTNAGTSRLSGARPGITSLACPKCGNSPIFVSPEKPVAICDKCETAVTTQEFADKIQAQKAQEMMAKQPVEAQGEPKTSAPPKSVEYEGGDVSV